MVPLHDIFERLEQAIEVENQLRQSDDLEPYADEIWLPEGATFDEVFTGQYLTCHRLDPLDALVSKAVKAPAKNRILIRQALAVFPELRSRVEESGGDLTQFEDES